GAFPPNEELTAPLCIPNLLGDTFLGTSETLAFEECKVGKTLFLCACLAGEGFLLYCLFQFVLESRRAHGAAGARDADVPAWLGSRSVIRFSRERAAASRNSIARTGASGLASREAVGSMEVKRPA
ncbi:MAG TPA: hypothetical protein VEH50_02290, partial [Methylomirabilota bacterium]|nr:hypothetical protein [Methylomirabilota bacterium]